jgi:hypothetical protein
VERATRWTLVVLVIAFGAGYGVAAQVWRGMGGPATGPATQTAAGPPQAIPPWAAPVARQGPPPSWAARALPPTPLLRPPPTSLYVEYGTYDYVPAPGPWGGSIPSGHPHRSVPPPAGYAAREDWPQARGFDPGDAWYPPGVSGEAWWAPEFHDGPPPPLPEDDVPAHGWGYPMGAEASIGMAPAEPVSPWAPAAQPVEDMPGVAPPSSPLGSSTPRNEGAAAGADESRWPPAWFPDPWAGPGSTPSPAPAGTLEGAPPDQGPAWQGAAAAPEWGPEHPEAGASPLESLYGLPQPPSWNDQPTQPADGPGSIASPTTEVHSP